MRFLVVNQTLRTIRSEQLTHVHSDSGLAEKLRDLGPIDATADWINLYKNGQLFGQVIGGTQTEGPSFLIEGGIQTQLGTNVFLGMRLSVEFVLSKTGK